MNFEIPREMILPVERIDVALDPAPHPFELANGAAIDANWISEKTANPALFDGQVAMLSQFRYHDGGLEGRCHPIRFATFLYWRKTKPWPDAEHTFAHPILVTSDGALIAVRMGKNTSNAGRVYFASGSFDHQDFPNGKVDVDFNMVREVREETGIDISQLPRDTIYHARSSDAGTVIFRRYWLPMTATEADTAIRAFVAREADPEIDEPVIIRSADDMPPAIMGHAAALVSWHFENSPHP
jgi:8-oxo-dGTP pyrophosphatase MutT (NUDIX family)